MTPQEHLTEARYQWAHGSVEHAQMHYVAAIAKHLIEGEQAPGRERELCAYDLKVWPCTNVRDAKAALLGEGEQ